MIIDFVSMCEFIRFVFDGYMMTLKHG